jgi:hypothetical protein
VGAMAGVALIAMAAVILVRTSRSRGWGLPHEVAVAAGALLSRALLAFTYFQLFGEVEPVRKYVHNGVLLAALLVLAFVAARNASAQHARLSTSQNVSPF